MKKENISIKEVPTVQETQNKDESSVKNNILKSTNMFTFNLNLDLSQADVEAPKADNSIALERFEGLANKEYYLIVQAKTNRRGNPYFWITATKSGEDREEFSIKANEKISSYLVLRLAGLSYTKVSESDANDLDTFSENVDNFEFTMYQAERAQGKTMKRTYTQRTQQISSYYKHGVIVYKPHLNPELQKHINA